MADDDHARARRTDPWTSHDAAESLDKEAIERLEDVVCYRLWLKRTGLITHEIADGSIVGQRLIGYQTITPRIKKLVKKGTAYWTEETRCWTGGPGSPATNRKSRVLQLAIFRPPEEKNGNGTHPNGTGKKNPKSPAGAKPAAGKNDASARGLPRLSRALVRRVVRRPA